jgi:hypothetical protein
MALPKGTVVPNQVNTSVYFSLDEFDPKVFDSLSDGIKKLIKVSPEYQAIANPNPAPQRKNTFADMDDDIPF